MEPQASTSELRFRFREFELARGGDALWRDGRLVQIRPKPLAMLAHLLRNRERVVSTGELLAVLWPNVSVSHQALWSAVRDLRRAIGDTDRLALWRGEHEQALKIARLVRSAPSIATSEARYGVLLRRQGDAAERTRGEAMLASAREAAAQLDMRDLAAFCAQH